MLNTNTDLGGMSTNRNTEGVKGHNEIYFGLCVKVDQVTALVRWRIITSFGAVLMSLVKCLLLAW